MTIRDDELQRERELQRECEDLERKNAAEEAKLAEIHRRIAALWPELAGLTDRQRESVLHRRYAALVEKQKRQEGEGEGMTT